MKQKRPCIGEQSTKAAAFALTTFLFCRSHSLVLLTQRLLVIIRVILIQSKVTLLLFAPVLLLPLIGTYLAPWLHLNRLLPLPLLATWLPSHSLNLTWLLPHLLQATWLFHFILVGSCRYILIGSCCFHSRLLRTFGSDSIQSSCSAKKSRRMSRYR